MSDHLSIDYHISIEFYMGIFGVLTKSLERYFSSVKFRSVFYLENIYSQIIHLFLWIFTIRCIGLLILPTDYYYTLGYTSEQANLCYLMIFYSLYCSIICYIYYDGFKSKNRRMDWLEPFQVLNGTRSPLQMGISVTMAEKYSLKVRKILNNLMLVISFRIAIGSAIFATLYMKNIDESKSFLDPVNQHSFLWIVLLTIWITFTSGIIFLSVSLFDCICVYFEKRFKKINNDLNSLIITRDPRTGATKNSILWKEILIEHNHICTKIKKYGRFWSKFILWSFIFLPLITIYSIYKLLYTLQQPITTKILYFTIIESFYLFCKISFSGSSVSEKVHSSYLSAVRASCGKYSLDLRMQIRLLIQRISGPTIGFYCSNFFALTSHSFYAMMIHLGQNFFLVVDFVISKNQSQNVSYG